MSAFFLKKKNDNNVLKVNYLLSHSVDIGTGHVLGRDSLGQSKNLDRRCDVLGHLGHIYNIYIYPLFGKLIIKLKSNYMIILPSNGLILMNIFLFCSSY